MIEQREVESYCRLCVAGCGIRVTVENDGEAAGEGERVTKVRGDVAHPLSRGYTCAKGRSLPSFHHDPRRLDEPALGRAAERRRTASWSEFTTDLADRVGRIVAEHGPDAIGIFAGSGSSDAAGSVMVRETCRALGTRSLFTPLTIDGPSKPLIGALMAGQPGVAFAAIDYEHATLTILVGTNPVVSHGQSNAVPDPRTRLRALRERGEVWVIDPRRTETARMATRHLAPRPGTDHVWLAAVVRELLAGIDHAGLAGLAGLAPDVAELAAAVEPYTLVEASRRTGLSLGELDDLVAAILRHGRFSGITGTGVTMAASANLSQWLMTALLVVTDSADVPGGTWFNPGFLRALDSDEQSWSALQTKPGPGSRPELPRQFGQMPAVALVDEIESGRIRALLVLGASPMTCLPDTERTRRALESVEVLAVLDVVANETTDLATHLAPCAGQLERADLTLSTDQYLPAVAVAYTPPVVAPAAHRREMWWILAQLLEALGHRALPGGRSAAETTADDLLAPLLGGRDADLDRLRRERVVVAHQAVHGWVRNGVEARGGWRLAPPPLVELLRDTPDPHGLSLVPRRQLRHVNSQLVETPGLTGGQDEPLVLVHPADAFEAGLSDGDTVEVSSAHGRLCGVVRIDHDLRRGAVSIPHGFATVPVNALTSLDTHVDGLTGMPQLSGTSVTLRPA